MANDWIKMRGGLFSSPKLIAIGKAMHDDRRFRDWLTPGGGGSMNGQIISDHALRCVTGALLTVTWSWSREYGKELPNGDCLLPHIDISGIDEIAGAPSVGSAMEAVGWAIEAGTDDVLEGVILPKFFIEHNVPMSQAEKQRRYRNRRKDKISVTETLPTVSNENGKNVTTREEKRREEVKSKLLCQQDLIKPENEKPELPISVTAFFKQWQQFAGTKFLPVPERLSKERKQKIATRLSTDGWYSEFLAACRKIPVPNREGFAWQPDIDWLIANDTNVSKVAEGKYDNKALNTKPPVEIYDA